MERNNARAALLEKALSLPAAPGVYIMRNSEGTVIYVGKSRKLCARVSQYFRNGEKNRKTERMVASVASFDTILVANEAEALTLENELIKKHKPRFNIRLKDSKSYPYIKITVNDEYPRVEYTRQRDAD
ncbi:MAG: GIY-YIG nuclease family protein, partial [Clostridia bacterium]|nr:GIY-YIG nuclease family protein [Clostridia bacterium]